MTPSAAHQPGLDTDSIIETSGRKSASTIVPRHGKSIPPPRVAPGVTTRGGVAAPRSDEPSMSGRGAIDHTSCAATVDARVRTAPRRFDQKRPRPAAPGVGESFGGARLSLWMAAAMSLMPLYLDRFVIPAALLHRDAAIVSLRPRAQSLAALVSSLPRLLENFR